LFAVPMKTHSLCPPLSLLDSTALSFIQESRADASHDIDFSGARSEAREEGEQR
jgi:hypothetical protein